MTKQALTVILVFTMQYGSAQNVGVGTPTPQEKLDVNGGVRIGYTPSAYSAGTVRFNNDEMEYNTGYGWRSMVNSFKDSSLSELTPFSTVIRNTPVEIPVSMTVTQQGVYLVIFKANGYNNSVYYPGSGNADQYGQVDFRLNGGSRARRSIIVAEDSYSSPASRRDFTSNPVEYTLIQTLFPGDKMQIFATMFASGTTPNPWVVNEAQILLIRLY
jgi:hypothetical protein